MLGIDEIALKKRHKQSVLVLSDLQRQCVIAVLHGRMGCFPPVLRMRRVTGSLPPQFVVGEIINIQTMRDAVQRSR